MGEVEERGKEGREERKEGRGGMEKKTRVLSEEGRDGARLQAGPRKSAGG